MDGARRGGESHAGGRTGARRATGTGGPSGAEFWSGAFGPEAFARAMGGGLHVLGPFAEMQQLMLARLQELQALEFDHARRLDAAGSPSEAVEILAAWGAARMEAAVDGQREMQRLVLDALSKAGDAVREATKT